MDVSPAVIVQRTIEEGASIIALSAVLTSAVLSIRQTVKACEEAGIRDRVTIIIGGACTSERVAKEVRADYYGQTPEDTLALCLAVQAG